jgi:hypothetical protein
MSFPILWARTISWHPVERPNSPEIRRPPTGGLSIFGGFALATGCQEIVYVPKMGNKFALDRTGFVATYKK